MSPKITANGREIRDVSWNGAVSRALANSATATTPRVRIEAAQRLADGETVRLAGVTMTPKEG